MDKFKKQPVDVLDYDVNFSDWFKTLEDDEIQSATVQIESDAEPVPTLLAGPDGRPSHQLLEARPLKLKVWLGGGTDGVDYKITVTITTAQDRVKQAEFVIKVRDV